MRELVQENINGPTANIFLPAHQQRGEGVEIPPGEKRPVSL